LSVQNLLHGLLLFFAEILVGLEENITILPQSSGHLFELHGMPFGLGCFALFIQITPMSAERVPNFAPDILQNMEVVALNVGFREDSLDGFGIRFPRIDVKSVHGQSKRFSLCV
jgi:hypothetical protein